MVKKVVRFLSRSDGESCFYKKNRSRRNKIVYIPVANSFTLERAFFVTKLLFCHSKFFFSCDRAPSGICSAETGFSPISFLTKLHFRDVKFFSIRASRVIVFLLVGGKYTRNSLLYFYFPSKTALFPHFCYRVFEVLLRLA